jgi:hypothetical protein
VKRVVLDKSGHHLADVLKALEDANNTSYILDSYIPSVSKYLLTKSPSIDYLKITTGLVLNCVKFNCKIARLALNIKQERLRDFERDKLERIAKDRQQINMTLPQRSALKANYQKLEERLRRSTKNIIARLNVKELAKRKFQETISELIELTGEFRDESDYKNIIKQIEIDKAINTRA